MPLGVLREGSRRYELYSENGAEAALLFAFDEGVEALLLTSYAAGLDEGALSLGADGALEVVARGYQCKDDSRREFAGRFGCDGAAAKALR